MGSNLYKGTIFFQNLLAHRDEIAKCTEKREKKSGIFCPKFSEMNELLNYPKLSTNLLLKWTL